jgi:hydrogenase maturation protease
MRLIGIGNDWRRDDGAGLEVARRLGGVGLTGEPIGLITAFAGEDDVVVVDAVSSGARPGTLHIFDASTERLPAALFGSSSTHALGLADAIEIARSLGRMPARVRVIGIEGARFDYGRGLTLEVEAAVETCTRNI